MAKAKVIGWYLLNEKTAKRRDTRVLPSFNRVDGKEIFSIFFEEPGGPRMTVQFDAQTARDVLKRWLPYLEAGKK